MSIEQNKALATELVKAISAGDADGIRKYVAADAKWWVMGFPRDRTLSRDQMIRGARDHRQDPSRRVQYVDPGYNRGRRPRCG
jgi:ketosteroid isomerase-like protein